MSRYDAIKRNLENIVERIHRACDKVGRDPNEITILPVSKTVDVDEVEIAMQLGINEFGENRVQELVRKYDYFENNDGDLKPEWHMIGHLQRNKVKYIIDKVKLIHSVDSLKLAMEINRQAEKVNKIMPILLQVNVSGEESKFGVNVDNVESIVTEMSYLSNIRLQGLMTMAPKVSDPEETRVYFRKLREMALDLTEKEFHNINMDILSMGMSNDFEIAIEEGSNIIRLGRIIFN